MIDKEKKNRSINRGEKWINGQKGKMGEKLDTYFEFTGKNNYVDFKEGLMNANTDIDPKRYEEATDDIDGVRPEKKTGRRESISEKIEAIQQKMADRVYNEDYRREQIDQKVKEIDSVMDKRETDILEGTFRGYHVELLRIAKPEKDENGNEKKTDPGDLDIMIGNKKVTVHEDLEGMTVSLRGSRPEVSSDIVRLAADEMASSGKMEWSGMAKEPKGDGPESGVEISADGVYGKTPVVISVKDGVDGVEFKPAGKYMSRDIWDGAFEEMKKNGSGRWMETNEAGSVISCGITAKINGRPAGIEGIVQDGAEDKSTVSADVWEKAYESMKKTGKQYWAETTEDGTTISISLSTSVDGDAAKIDDSLGDGQIADMPARAVIGREMWNEGIEGIIKDPSMMNKATFTLEDGRPFELRMGMRVNGIASVPNAPYRDGEVRETKSGITISRDIAEKAIDEMDSKKSTTLKTTIADGREISFKRPFAFKMFVDGQEINDNEFDAALAQISGLESDHERDEMGKGLRAIDEQVKIGMSRRAAAIPLKIPAKAVGTMVDDVRRSDGSAASLLRMLLGQAARAIGR